MNIHGVIRGSGWPTSLRLWYTMLALPLSGFELRPVHTEKTVKD